MDVLTADALPAPAADARAALRRGENSAGLEQIGRARLSQIDLWG